MSASSPAPGWYPDPAGSGGRWWDGRQWTSYRSVPPPTGVVQPLLPAGTSTGTPWIWAQAALPLLQVLTQLPYLLSFRGIVATQFSVFGRYPGSATPTRPELDALLGQYSAVFAALAITTALALLLSAAWVVLAVLDHRQLTRIGVAQPFHWAWALLGLVYPIGRAVVVHRRTGRGLGPLWLLIAATAGSGILAVAVQILVLLPTFTSIASLRPDAAGCGC